MDCWLDYVFRVLDLKDFISTLQQEVWRPAIPEANIEKKASSWLEASNDPIDNTGDPTFPASENVQTIHLALSLKMPSNTRVWDADSRFIFGSDKIIFTCASTHGVIESSPRPWHPRLSLAWLFFPKSHSSGLDISPKGLVETKLCKTLEIALKISNFFVELWNG